MTEQPDLFGASDVRGRLATEIKLDRRLGAEDRKRAAKTAPHNGTDTSRLAAARQTPTRISATERRIMSELQVRASFGATCDEIECATGLSHQTASARIRGMVLDGKVRDSGERRKTRTGSTARVYVATRGTR